MEERKIAAEVALLIYPECQLSAVHGLTDLFRIAGQWSMTDAPLTRPVIRVSHWQARKRGRSVECVWDSDPNVEHAITHVIAPPSIAMPERMIQMPDEAAWMKTLHAAGSTLCSVCAGAFVLAETGLLEGRCATTHWAFAKQLAARYPGIRVAEEHMVLDDGDIITAGGILAWTDLGLTLVERLLGPSVMLATARFLLIDPPRQHQRQYARFFPRFDHGDAAVLRAQHHLHANAAQAPSVASLAALAGVSERTFLRRFAKATGERPKEYLQQVRISKAREELELNRRPIDQIAWDVGYRDAAAFRKAFHKFTGIAPNLYRQRFGGDGSAE